MHSKIPLYADFVPTTPDALGEGLEVEVSNRGRSLYLFLTGVAAFWALAALNSCVGLT